MRADTYPSWGKQIRESESKDRADLGGPEFVD